MTPCGHNFCSECISECLNRKHQCPVCNSSVTKQQLIKNKHVDRIVVILQREKEKASKAYFDRLIQVPKLHDSQNIKNSSPSKESSLNNKNVKFSPIEELFHRYMKKSLLSYEEYYEVFFFASECIFNFVFYIANQLKMNVFLTENETKVWKNTREFEKRIHQENDGYKGKIWIKSKEKSREWRFFFSLSNMFILYSMTFFHFIFVSFLEKYKKRMDQKISELKKEFEEKFEQLTKSFEESVQLLASSYEAFESFLNSFFFIHSISEK